MKFPAPRTLTNVMSDKLVKFKTHEYPTPKGKRGPTFKGLKTQVKQLR